MLEYIYQVLFVKELIQKRRRLVLCMSGTLTTNVLYTYSDTVYDILIMQVINLSLIISIAYHPPDDNGNPICDTSHANVLEQCTGDINLPNHSGTVTYIQTGTKQLNKSDMNAFPRCHYSRPPAT